MSKKKTNRRFGGLEPLRKPPRLEGVVQNRGIKPIKKKPKKRKKEENNQEEQ